ncbi:DUF3138 family protein [Aquabacterium sp.]|uniref:DUF3138 family protein n=1 Tax=Aquabacterium sp. TaxID=1872578 RepID=UPI002CE433B1|nr:DUF3138 family protein [Aquabacterium sp.]HSW09172.1 DUF3138 family protein [Aquabacterium sp.]
MSRFKLSLVTLAALASLGSGAQAQSNDEVLKELRALRDRVTELERKLKDAEAKSAKPAEAQWGMTPQQVQDFNRIAVKTEALEDAIESQGLKMLKISGYADPTYLYNQRQRRGGFQFLNPVDSDGYNYDNSYFGSASLDFQKEMEGGTRWRLTLVPNRGTGAVIGDASVVHEASVSVPLGDLQTRFIAGQVPDWSGYEYLQPTLNKLITHNLLFDFTLPTAYTGAGMEITRGKWIYKWMLGNMNASKRNANERTPAFAYRVDYSRGEFQGFGFAGVHGKAANFSENAGHIEQTVNEETGEVVDVLVNDATAQRDSRVDLFEFDAYFIRGDLTVQGQLSYGRQRFASITPRADGSLRDSRWVGASGLIAYKFIPRWEVISRLDYLRNNKNGGGLLGYTAADDRNGFGPDATLGCAADNIVDGCDKGANRVALSVGLSYLFNLNTVLKAEYRVDRANLPVFLDVRTGEYRKSNAVFGTSVVVSF